MKILIGVFILTIVAVLFSSTSPESYQILEKSLPLVLGASLGGVLACTSIVVSVLSASSTKTKKKAENSQNFQSFVSSLETDVKILVICLFFAVAMPYLRTLNYPFSIEAFGLTSEYLKHKLISSFEIFIALLAFSIIYEIVSVLVSILRKMMIIHTDD